jgi:signal transduction histidine kinase
MNDAIKSWKWHWVPLTFVLIGVLSILLFSAIHRFRLQQQVNSTLNDALLHLEVDTALFHLRVEDYIAGEPRVDLGRAVASMDKAIGLTQVMLEGGSEPEQVFLARAVLALGLSARASELKTQLVSFKALGLTRARDPRRSGSGSAADLAFDQEFANILQKAAGIEAVCKADTLQTRRSSQKLMLCMYLCWGLFLVSATAGIWRVELRRKRAETSLVEANAMLFSQAAELTRHREHLEDLVQTRTAALSEANATLMIMVGERMQAAEARRGLDLQIRELSAELLQAQERERKRISMELHDELGQALNVMKLQIRGIERELDPRQIRAQGDCEKLLSYLDEEIEEVRRLSLALSPAVLEELGLVSALRWLISSFKSGHALQVDSEVAEIDSLFPEPQRVTIYRVVQEALANIDRHARATSATVRIRLRDRAVDFVVEDDGEGFDPDEARGRGPAEKGVGLTTMGQRVAMLGGVFQLTSSPGGGTRIRFSLPVGAVGC